MGRYGGNKRNANLTESLYLLSTGFCIRSRRLSWFLCCVFTVLNKPSWNFVSKCGDFRGFVRKKLRSNIWFSTFEGDQWRATPSKQAFLFSLVNPFETGQVRIPAEEKESGCTIVSASTFGPTFRREWHPSSPTYLHISDNANSSRSSYCCLRDKFSSPEGKPGDLFFTGAKKFNVVDYEVFEFY